MATLNKHARSPHSPSPIFGIRPGFTVGDIESRYSNPLRVYGTYSAPNLTEPVGTWDSVQGRWTETDKIVTQRSTADSGGTIISPNARVVKVYINITGTGTVDISLKSASDSYTAVIVDFGALRAGSYEFFVGGWSSVDSDNTSYQATQYGPVGAQSEATSNLSQDTDNNYIGGTYNPFQCLSLDGYALKFFAAVVGTVGFDVSVTPVS